MLCSRPRVPSLFPPVFSRRSCLSFVRDTGTVGSYIRRCLQVWCNSGHESRQLFWSFADNWVQPELRGPFIGVPHRVPLIEYTLLRPQSPSGKWISLLPLKRRYPGLLPGPALDPGITMGRQGNQPSPQVEITILSWSAERRGWEHGIPLCEIIFFQLNPM